MLDEIKELNEKLKTIKTWSDFVELNNEVESSGSALVFRMKRSKFRAYSFSQYKDLDRVHYLISDGVSTGCCNIDRLFRYIEISNNCR